jgi:nucleotide-binding universal stress UspA family protein
MKLDRILVAVDGSDNSLVAAGWAGALGASVGAEVVAVHAMGLLERLEPGEEKVPAQTHRDEVERLLAEEWSAPVAAAGAKHRCVLRDGTPVQVVLDVAEEEGADLIVLGSRGLGAYPEQLLGSTSTQVAQHSSRPVTIVPAG